MPSKRFSWLVKAMLLVRNSSCLDFSTTPSASRIQAGHGSVEPESPFWILVSNHDTPSCKSWHRAEQFSLFRRLLHRPDCRQLLTRTSTGSGCDDVAQTLRPAAPAPSSVKEKPHFQCHSCPAFGKKHSFRRS